MPTSDRFWYGPQVYTFHMFQHLVDLAAYQLHVSLYRFDLAHYLAGQPLRIMMQVRRLPRGGMQTPVVTCCSVSSAE